MHLTEEELIDHVVLGETKAHVAGCAKCREDAQTLDEALALTRDLPPPPEGHFDELWSRVEWRLPPRPARRTVNLPLLAIAAMLAIVCAAVLAGWQMGKREAVVPKAPVARTTTTPVQDTPDAALTSSPPVEKVAVHSPRVFYAPGARPPTIPPPGTYRVTSPKPFIVNVTAPASASREQDADDLAKMAGTAESLDKRIEAVNALMLVASTRADDDLATLYQKESNETMRHAIIHALFIRGIQQFPRQRGKQALRQMLFHEKDPDRQKELEEAIRLIEAREMKQHRTGNDQPRW